MDPIVEYILEDVIKAKPQSNYHRALDAAGVVDMDDLVLLDFDKWMLAELRPVW